VGWTLTSHPVCNYVAVTPSDTPGPRDKGPVLRTADFEFTNGDSSICWAPTDPNINGWSPNLVTPVYTNGPRQLAGACRIYVSSGSGYGGYGVLSGHLIIHIGFPPVCVVAAPDGVNIVVSEFFEAAVAC
jgi:hypothetical protein